MSIHDLASDPRGAARMRTRRMARCNQCGQGIAACLCDVLSPIAVRTKIWVLVHHVEAWKTTNTGRLAALTMGARFQRWGDPADKGGDASMPEGPVLLLFPTEEAELLTPAHAAMNPTLVVPDGTWPQARKIARRVETLCAGRVRRVRVETDAPSRCTFRRTQRDGALSTFEALATAVSILEGEQADRVLAECHALLATFVARQIRVQS